jgi:hypothetical protein
VKGRIIGIVVLVVIAAAALVWQFGFRKNQNIGVVLTGKTQTVKGLIGSEKTGFLEDEQVKKILRSKYGLVVDYSTAGSIEMVRGTVGADVDFLWPSSQVALELYRLQRDNPSVKSEIIFSSPIVLYSWDIVSDALVKQGIVEKQGDTFFVSGFAKLLALDTANKSWSDIGLTELYGRIAITTTDPNKSNSGMMFSGLMADVLNGDVVDETTVKPLLPIIRGFYRKLGYMENTTGVLFDQYLRAGVGSYPLIAGYENQIVEFSLQNKDLWLKVKDKMRILYPVPTVWSSHPFISLTSKAASLMQALKDPEIQKIAWEQHGFRTGLTGVQNDPKALQITGIPESVTKVMPMPTPQVMDLILSAIQGGTP